MVNGYVNGCAMRSTRPPNGHRVNQVVGSGAVRIETSQYQTAAGNAAVENTAARRHCRCQSSAATYPANRTNPVSRQRGAARSAR